MTGPEAPARMPGDVATHFEAAGSLDPPRIIGRTVRFLVGAFLLYNAYVLVVDWPVFLLRETAPRYPGYWIFLAIVFVALPYVVNIGFTVDWRRRPQYGFALLLAVAVVGGIVTLGRWWGWPAEFVAWAGMFYVSLHLGLSFVLAAVIATPGCEMRALPHLWTLVTGRSTSEHYCPGFLTRVDHWEWSRFKR